MVFWAALRDLRIARSSQAVRRNQSLNEISAWNYPVNVSALRGKMIMGVAVVSLDGYIADDNDGVGRLFDWMGNGDVRRF